MTFMKRLIAAETDKDFLLAELKLQERVGLDYVNFIIAADKRAFSVEVALIVDGQFSSSTIMVNSQDKAGKAVLDYLAHVGAGELLKIRANISELTSIPKKGEGI